MIERSDRRGPFNNEFRAAGHLRYFRSFEQRVEGDPAGRVARLSQAIMIAGGLAMSAARM